MFSPLLFTQFKMLPATVQLNLRSSSFIVNPSSNYAFPNRKLLSVERPIFITNPNGLSFRPGQLIIRRNFGISASSAVAEDTSTDDSISPTPPQKQLGALQKLGVVVKPMEKPRLVLKFLWMEKNIGLAIDQVIPGYGTIPLSPYYFWPRKDAWEELKVMLESKPWISQKEMVILLNQATDIINLWQQSGGELA